MPTREIPREEWSKFFDVFSRQHEGWLATLEIFAPECRRADGSSRIALEGISIASGGSVAEAIAISLGKKMRKITSRIQSQKPNTFGLTDIWRSECSPGDRIGKPDQSRCCVSRRVAA